jgi:hypothetical protein
MFARFTEKTENFGAYVNTILIDQIQYFSVLQSINLRSESSISNNVLSF